jgi:hypothetical protein
VNIKEIAQKDLIFAGTVLAAGYMVLNWWQNRNTQTPAQAQATINTYDQDNVRIYWPKGSNSIITINLKTQAAKFHKDVTDWANKIPFERDLFWFQLKDDLAQVPGTVYNRFKQLYVEQFGSTPDQDAEKYLYTETYDALKQLFPYL